MIEKVFQEKATVLFTVAGELGVRRHRGTADHGRLIDSALTTRKCDFADIFLR